MYPTVEGMPGIFTQKDVEHIPQELPRHQTELVTFHLFGSCPMGERRIIVPWIRLGRFMDRRGWSWQTRSVLCTALGVNPQGTIMAVARRNVLKFMGKI